MGTNLINTLHLIDKFGEEIIKGEFSKIIPSNNDVIGKNSEGKNEVKNEALKKLANLYIDGAEFGVTCIIPNLPWFIQLNIINAIKESNNEKTTQVAYVLTSKDMAIGIDYPLNSVIIKAPNGTNINTPNLYKEEDFEKLGRDEYILTKDDVTDFSPKEMQKTFREYPGRDEDVFKVKY